MPISIVTTNHHPSDIEQLRGWFIAEWGAVDPICASNCPPPILAKEKRVLVGGLAFSQAQRPGSECQAIWINALYVEPNSRGKRIAALLIQRAETLAAASHLEELFVFTKIPQLYGSLDWQPMTEDVNGHVFRKELRGDN